MLCRVCRPCRRLYSTKQPAKSKWISTVGLEVHAQINTRSKLFSGASTEFGKPVNSNVSYFDAAIPGTLPVLNRTCVEKALLTALSLNCTINPVSSFDRKHYFYADLPAGYQITQQRQPLATGGFIEFHMFRAGAKKPLARKCRIRQLQLEQDSGKSLHDDHVQRSLIDLNRAGVGLMEVVFEPDIACGEEAAALVKELSLILGSLGACTARMQEGALRVDVNVSIRPSKEAELGVRSEVKNISSLRGVCKAVDYEIQRQIRLREGGLPVLNETRAWDPDSAATLPMRDKEVKQDYRFMAEPNLPPLRVSLSDPPTPGLISVQEIRRRIPTLPAQTREMLVSRYALTLDYAVRLVNEPDLLKTFLGIMESKPSAKPKTVSSILINDVLTLSNKGVELTQMSLNVGALGDLCEMVDTDTINSATCKKLLEEVLNGCEDPKKVVEDRGWSQVSDEEEVSRLCRQAMEDNPRMVSDYRGGKTQALQALVGAVARASRGRANLRVATGVLTDLLRSDR